jgi:hypothetical protein
MERVYEPLVQLQSAQMLASSARAAGRSHYVSRLRRLLVYLWADPMGERFAREQDRDQHYLLRR